MVTKRRYALKLTKFRISEKTPSGASDVDSQGVAALEPGYGYPWSESAQTRPLCHRIMQQGLERMTHSGGFPGAMAVLGTVAVAMGDSPRRIPDTCCQINMDKTYYIVLSVIRHGNIK